jgi:hypothetical protein
VRLLNVWKSLSDICKVRIVQLTHTVWIQFNDKEWVNYAPGADSITVLSAFRNPVDFVLKGASKPVIDSNCNGYSKAALLQPMNSALANRTNKRDNRLIRLICAMDAV